MRIKHIKFAVIYQTWTSVHAVSYMADRKK